MVSTLPIDNIYYKVNGTIQHMSTWPYSVITTDAH